MTSTLVPVSHYTEFQRTDTNSVSDQPASRAAACSQQYSEYGRSNARVALDMPFAFMKNILATQAYERRGGIRVTLKFQPCIVSYISNVNLSSLRSSTDPETTGCRLNVSSGRDARRRFPSVYTSCRAHFCIMYEIMASSPIPALSGRSCCSATGTAAVIIRRRVL